MLFIIGCTAIIITFIGVIIQQITGNKIFVQNLRAALIRFGAGVALSLFPIIWWGLSLYDLFEVNIPLKNIIPYMLLACCASAFVLIPLSIFQIIIFLIKWALSDHDLGSGGSEEAD